MASLFQSFGFGKSADIRVGYHFSGLTLAYGQLKKKKERKGEKKRAREKEREGDDFFVKLSHFSRIPGENTLTRFI